MAVDFSPWDANKAWANGAASDDPAAFYNGICAGKKAGDPKTQGAHALPFKYHPGDGPNAAGVRNALARINQTEGLTNKAEAQAKLESAMKEVQAAEAKKSRVDFARRAGTIPGGTNRSQVAFPTELRGQLVHQDGRQLFHVTGYATTFNAGYEMWDMCGPYTEVMDSVALDRSLSAGPDVSFLVNHHGLTMARTKSRTGEPTLFLRKDTTGLNIEAYLNYARQDVRDLASAMDDHLVDEMSFAFMLNDGKWNDDFTEFRITEADINRGDVSAVNYGANPYTSIEARSAAWLRDIERVPEVVAEAAFQRIRSRFGPFDFDEDIDDAAMFEDSEPEPIGPEPEEIQVRSTQPKPGGKSLHIWRMRLSDDS